MEYLCDTREYKTASKYHLKRHVLSVYVGKTFSCEYCEVKIRRRDFIKRHVQSMHFLLKFKYDECKKEFRRHDGRCKMKNGIIPKCEDDLKQHKEVSVQKKTKTNFNPE